MPSRSTSCPATSTTSPTATGTVTCSPVAVPATARSNSAPTATAGRLLTLEEVQTAFNERSKALVTADFVAAYVKTCTTVLCEAEALTRLCENVTGLANKRASARWLSACVGSLRFETEMRTASDQTAAQKLGVLATLARAVREVHVLFCLVQDTVDAGVIAAGAALRVVATMTIEERAARVVAARMFSVRSKF